VPPRVNSRYSLVVGVTRLSDGLTFLLDREPFRFADRADNRRVVVKGGDTLQSLAVEHFKPVAEAAELWWVIADYQPDPIEDPTLDLDEGRILFIPSVEYVLSQAFSDASRDAEDI
jgi:hypothetical protein